MDNRGLGLRDFPFVGLTRSTIAGVLGGRGPLTTRSTSTDMPWITKEYRHVKQIRMPACERSASACRPPG
jgi:hypothetical protein